jgi:hypothetical protein
MIKLKDLDLEMTEVLDGDLGSILGGIFGGVFGSTGNSYTQSSLTNVSNTIPSASSLGASPRTSSIFDNSNASSGRYSNSAYGTSFTAPSFPSSFPATSVQGIAAQGGVTVGTGTGWIINVGSQENSVYFKVN